MHLVEKQTKKINFKINGHDVEAIVSIKFDYESDPDFSFWDEELKIETQDAIASGKTSCIYVQAEIHFEGLTGMDSLGMVFVRNSSFNKDVMQSVDDHGMIDNAKADLIAQVFSLATKLAKYTKAA